MVIISYIIYTILLYILYILYIILYIISYTYTIISYTILSFLFFLIFSSSSDLFLYPIPFLFQSSSFPPICFCSSSQPFYTCRYFHLLIYIIPILLLSSSFILYLSGVTSTYLYSSVYTLKISSSSSHLPLPPLILYHLPLIYLLSLLFFPYNPPLPTSLPIFILYLSVLGYTYLYSIYLSSKYLTPHVLSEWMVEVCIVYLCGVRFWFMV